MKWITLTGHLWSFSGKPNYFDNLRMCSAHKGTPHDCRPSPAAEIWVVWAWAMSLVNYDPGHSWHCPTRSARVFLGYHSISVPRVAGTYRLRIVVSKRWASPPISAVSSEWQVEEWESISRNAPCSGDWNWRLQKQKQKKRNAKKETIIITIHIAATLQTMTKAVEHCITLHYITLHYITELKTLNSLWTEQCI